MQLGIVGGGVVGKATARCFMEHADVRVYDVDPTRRTHSLPDVLEGRLVFVCLPTPQREGFLDCDLSYVDKFFRDHAGYKTNFVLRSTVPIGTTEGLSRKYDLSNIVHSPEFLTARCSLVDAQIPARNIIGATKGTNLLTIRVLERLYRERFRSTPIFTMRSDESEAVKLFLNSFFAVKVAYWNEVRTLADRLGLNWGTIMEGVLSDGRIAHSHTQVPGPDGLFGFGGTCLPKDLASLVSFMTDMGVMCPVTFGAHLRNLDDRKRMPK